jgi:hypothetical protein
VNKEMKGLEGLKSIKNSLDILIENNYRNEEINIIEKELKALEIIKRNLGIDLSVLKYYETVQEWNDEFW